MFEDIRPERIQPVSIRPMKVSARSSPSTVRSKTQEQIGGKPLAGAALP